MDKRRRMLRVLQEERSTRADATSCPDCPVLRVDVFAGLVPPRATSCALRCLALPARASLPPRWFQDYALGVVRRGIVIRQRVDVQGRAVTVDVVGPGGLLPFAERGHADAASRSGYAVGELLVCVCPRGAMDRAVATESETAQDLVRLQARAIERMDRLADARGRPKVIERVASILCALADCLPPAPGGDFVSSDLLHVDYGALVTARQESVCRAFGVLERRGLIARSSGGVQILDRPALQAV
jgi:CRP-like cAMP-binding protein